MTRSTRLKMWLFGDDSTLSQSIRASQMAIATSGTPPLAIGTLVNSALVAYVLRGAVPWPVLAVWVALNWLAASRRLLSWSRQRNRKPASGVRRRGVVRVTVWSALAGILWGMAALPLIWSDGYQQELFIVFVIAGHAAVAATWLAPIPSAYWAYLFPCMIPLIGSILVDGTYLSVLEAVMLSLYTGVLSHFGWTSFRSFRDSIRANVEREEAMRQLAASKAEVEKRVEERTAELRREQRLLQAIFDSIPIWLFVKDPEGRFLAVNQRMARDLAMEPTQVLGRSLAEICTLHDDGAAADTRTDQEALQTGNNVGIRELKCTTVDGKLRTLRMVKVPLAGAQGDADCIVGAAEDFSERARLEQQLQHAQKLQAVGQLAGGVAHEFNNLLQVIKGFTHLALRELSPQDPVRNHLIRVIDSTVTAASLTSQLLAFGRRDVVRRENVDLAAMMARLVEMLRHILGGSVEIALNQEPKLPMLTADRGMIEQTVMNLCLNARDAMPNGGKLTIETRSLQAEEPVNHLLGLERAGTYLEIRITDTGIGMTPEVMERIFEPFFTTKEVGNGSGLGLSVAYGIVEQHGGKIRVQSRPGEGASFSIFLPAADPKGLVNPAMTGMDFSKPALAHSATILVAEDDEAVRHLAVQLLELEGYRVLHASDGQQAVRVWENSTEPIDLLILDLVMPTQGGREAYERIATLQADIPVIFCTGYVSDTIDNIFLSNSKATLLRKPYAPDRLLQVVREALLSARRGAEKMTERPQYPV